MTLNIRRTNFSHVFSGMATLAFKAAALWIAFLALAEHEIFAAIGVALWAVCYQGAARGVCEAADAYPTASGKSAFEPVQQLHSAEAA
jgi:hypothetical protein